MKATEETWLTRIREWKASGLTAKQFTEGKPYRASSLVWRKWQLQRDHGGGATKSKGEQPETVRRERSARRGIESRSARKLTTSPSIVQVVRRPASANPSAGVPQAGGVVVEIGQARIEVGVGFDAALLHDVVRALQGAA